jgi:hypothetical protein
MKVNNMGSVNVNPKALEEFLKEDCIEVGSVLRIRIRFGQI